MCLSSTALYVPSVCYGCHVCVAISVASWFGSIATSLIDGVLTGNKLECVIDPSLGVVSPLSSL